MTTIETQNYTLDDLSHFWSAEGLPVFHADRDDICDIVESLGFSIYYLLATTPKVINNNSNSNKNKSNKSNNNNNNKNPNQTTYTAPPTTVYETTWFKVVNNFVGRSVSKCDPSLSDNYISISESAHYTMPLIPTYLIDKLDQFFRLVEAQHGTESIVMLTYDLDKEGSDGWGILVPDQENTAAHCNYDPHSIAEMKPDNVMIVGSVHSHPGMAAYASGTDHADQADFDGIHITFGWQKSVNNGATQYHLEMQMAGQAYTLKPEDVFENYTIDKEPDPDVVEWSGRVKKELPPSWGDRQNTLPTTTTPNRSLPHQATNPGTPDPYLTPGIYASSKIQWHSEVKKIPYFKDIPEGSFIVLETSVHLDNVQGEYCLVCNSYIDSYSLYDGICDVCMVPIVSKGTSRELVLENVSLYASQLKFSTSNPVYLIGKDDGNSFFAMKLCEDLSEYVSVSKTSSLNDPIDEESYLLCCGIHIDDIATCFCTPQIVFDDFLDFDLDTRDIDVYDKDITSQCSSCDNYMQASCPSIRDNLIDYIDNRSVYMSKIAVEPPAIVSHNCDSYKPYYVFDEDQYQDEYKGSLYYET